MLFILACVPGIFVPDTLWIAHLFFTVADIHSEQTDLYYGAITVGHWSFILTISRNSCSNNCCSSPSFDHFKVFIHAYVIKICDL